MKIPEARHMKIDYPSEVREARWRERSFKNVEKTSTNGLTLWTVGKFGSEELSKPKCRHSSLSWLFVLKGFA